MTADGSASASRMVSMSGGSLCVLQPGMICRPFSFSSSGRNVIESLMAHLQGPLL
jgi:hypothetical protein